MASFEKRFAMDIRRGQLLIDKMGHDEFYVSDKYVLAKFGKDEFYNFINKYTSYKKTLDMSEMVDDLNKEEVGIRYDNQHYSTSDDRALFKLFRETEKHLKTMNGERHDDNILEYAGISMKDPLDGKPKDLGMPMFVTENDRMVLANPDYAKLITKFMKRNKLVYTDFQSENDFNKICGIQSHKLKLIVMPMKSDEEEMDFLRELMENIVDISEIKASISREVEEEKKEEIRNEVEEDIRKELKEDMKEEVREELKESRQRAKDLNII